MQHERPGVDSGGEGECSSEGGDKSGVREGIRRRYKGGIKRRVRIGVDLPRPVATALCNENFVLYILLVQNLDITEEVGLDPTRHNPVPPGCLGNDGLPARRCSHSHAGRGMERRRVRELEGQRCLLTLLFPLRGQLLTSISSDSYLGAENSVLESGSRRPCQRSSHGPSSFALQVLCHHLFHPRHPWRRILV